MKLITQREKIKNIRMFWSNMYGPFPRVKSNSIIDDWFFKKEHKGADGIVRSKVDMWNELQKLDLDAATPEDVENIVGKGNLVRIFCSNCGEEVQEAIQFDADENDVDLCGECLFKASNILNNIYYKI